VVLKAFEKLYASDNIYFLQTKFGRSVRTNSVQVVYYIKKIKYGT
jgi:hypothetical protein